MRVYARPNHEVAPECFRGLTNAVTCTFLFALPYAVNINTRAGPQLARSAADYVAWGLRNPSQFQDLGCENDETNPHNSENQEQVNEKYSQFKQLVARTPIALRGWHLRG